MENDVVIQKARPTDMVDWCKRGYEKFWFGLRGYTDLEQMEKENHRAIVYRVTQVQPPSPVLTPYLHLAT